MKVNLLEICFTSQHLPAVQAELGACLREHSGTIIGFQTQDNIARFIVRLGEQGVEPYLLKLTATLERGLIHAFHPLVCTLFKISFRQPYPVSLLNSFPGRAGELWFPAVRDETVAYLGLISSTLSQEQMAWLAAQPSILECIQEPQHL